MKTNAPHSHSHTPHGAPRLFRHEKAHENGRGCDTKRPQAGLMTRLLGWGVLLVFMVLTGRTYAGLCQLTLVNGTTSDYALVLDTYPSTAQLYLPMKAGTTSVYTVEQQAWEGAFLLNAGGIHSYPGMASVATSTRVIGGIGGFYSTGGLTVRSLATSSDGGTQQADTEALVAGFQFACVLGFGFVLMWVYRRMHGPINHNQP